MARFGGDEFVLLIAGTSEDQVGKVLARLARSHPAPWTSGAVLCSEDESLDEALERADAASRGEAPGAYAEVPTATPGAPGISSGHTGSRSASALAIWRAMTSRWISLAPS